MHTNTYTPPVTRQSGILAGLVHSPWPAVCWAYASLDRQQTSVKIIRTIESDTNTHQNKPIIVQINLGFFRFIDSDIIIFAMVFCLQI